ncbi:MAG: Holliday junction branch migration protein RuvA [Lachnospiraceae bacterium]|nr:Holliday junction branch migration protein RuvA [Lachnospiraceae bacterium]
MYAYLIGKVADVSGDNLVMEVGHIGYNVRIPGSVIEQLPAVGEEVKIYTYTSVREDAIQLFGFLTKDDLEMYKLLITVNGIGPKGGLSVLSAMSADELRLAVLAQDAKRIAKAPGVGSKTAQRIILDLKDKISMEDAFTPLENADDSAAAAASNNLSQVRSEAVEALTALGYSASDALRAVRAVEQEDMNVEELLKAALKKMF